MMKWPMRVKFTDLELDAMGECLKIAASAIRESIHDLRVRNPHAQCAPSLRKLLNTAIRVCAKIEKR